MYITTKEQKIGNMNAIFYSLNFKTIKNGCSSSVGRDSNQTILSNGNSPNHCPNSFINIKQRVREGLPKKSSCSFGLCPNEAGGRALPKFFVHFSQTVYIGSIWGWGGRGRPLPNFLAHLHSKKVVQVVQIMGKGLR